MKTTNQSTRLLALLLSLVMVFALAACGTAEPTEDTAAEVAEEAAPAEPAAEETAAEEVEAVGEPIEITVATTFSQTDFEGQVWQYLMDYATEKSGGTITFNVYWSGTLATFAEELDLLNNGDIDMMAVLAAGYAFVMPEIVTMQKCRGVVQDTADFYDYISYENEITSAILNEAFAQHNAMLLGGEIIAGKSYFVSTEEFSTFEEFQQYKLGVASEGNYKTMGFDNMVIVQTTEQYESLRTGVCETVDSSIDTIIASQLFEVAKYYMPQNNYRGGNWFTMNIDTFNSMSAEQQAIIKEAAAAATDYSVELVEEMESQLADIFAENDCVSIDMDEDQFADYFYGTWEISSKDIAQNLATATGHEETVVAMLEQVNEYFGYDIDLLG